MCWFAVAVPLLLALCLWNAAMLALVFSRIATFRRLDMPVPMWVDVLYDVGAVSLAIYYGVWWFGALYAMAMWLGTAVWRAIDESGGGKCADDGP